MLRDFLYLIHFHFCFLQWSILGSLFSLLYGSDMKSACDCNLYLYTDDLDLLVLVITKHRRYLIQKFKSVFGYLKGCLYIGKTEYILFDSSVKLRKSPGFKVKAGETVTFISLNTELFL